VGQCMPMGAQRGLERLCNVVGSVLIPVQQMQTCSAEVRCYL
jgi:hypothetical protein